MKNEIVDVVIPIYKEKPDEDDVLSIRHTGKISNNICMSSKSGYKKLSKLWRSSF